MVSTGTWIVLIIIGAVALFLLLKGKHALTVFGTDLNNLIAKCPQCSGNQATPACKACLNANAPGVVKAGGSLF